MRRGADHTTARPPQNYKPYNQLPTFFKTYLERTISVKQERNFFQWKNGGEGWLRADEEFSDREEVEEVNVLEEI
jgi:hypothetical protein